MQLTKRLLTGMLVSSLAVVSSTFAISSDGGPIQTADAIKKASQFPEVKYQSVTDTEKKNYELQKQQMQTKLESMKGELELKKKTLSTSFEEEKKQLMSSCEAKKKAIYDEFNGLSEEEKKAQKATLEEKMKAVRADCEAQKKELQARMEEKMKALKSELEAQNKSLQSDMEAKKKTLEKEWEGKKQDMEAKKKELKDKLGKVPGTDSTMTSEEMIQCKATFDTLRTEREANAKARKEARNVFWEANKGTAKDIFVADGREDVKDILDSMRLQIRLVERKYAKSLVGTASVAQTTDYALGVIDTIVQKTRTDVAEYVQDGKQDQFNAFRDGFISVLKANKSSLLTMMYTHAQTIKGLNGACKKKVSVTMTQSDTLDRQTQGQLYSMVAGRNESVKEKKPFETGDKPTQPQSSTQ